MTDLSNEDAVTQLWLNLRRELNIPVQEKCNDLMNKSNNPSLKSKEVTIFT